MQGFGVLLLVLRYRGYARGLKRGVWELTASEEAGPQSCNRKELGSTLPPARAWKRILPRASR